MPGTPRLALNEDVVSATLFLTTTEEDAFIHGFKKKKGRNKTEEAGEATSIEYHIKSHRA